MAAKKIKHPAISHKRKPRILSPSERIRRIVQGWARPKKSEIERFHSILTKKSGVGEEQFNVLVVSKDPELIEKVKKTADAITAKRIVRFGYETKIATTFALDAIGLFDSNKRKQIIRAAEELSKNPEGFKDEFGTFCREIRPVITDTVRYKAFLHLFIEKLQIFLKKYYKVSN